MGTRGLYGIRKNEIDKTTYNHYDSYPEWLGKNMVEFCATTSEEEMNKIYDKIIMVDESDKPTNEEIAFCIANGLYDERVSSRSVEDWYCLLRKAQGEISVLKDLINKNDKAYMIDNSDFIEDSLFCEYAYIINLDTHCLEFYEGFQHEAQVGNRYGEKPTTTDYAPDYYYPCRLVMKMPLAEIKNVKEIVQKMSDAVYDKEE